MGWEAAAWLLPYEFPKAGIAVLKDFIRVDEIQWIVHRQHASPQWPFVEYNTSRH